MNHNRPLHQLGMTQQQFDDRLLGRVSSALKLQLRKALVLTHQLTNRPLEDRNNLLERGASRWRFEILNSVELDTAPFE